MSMKFNGIELSDVYFNGTQLDKVYFNGILVFEKVSGYFRRMLLGEELKGATFKADFSNLVSWDNIKARIPNNYSNNTLIAVNNGDSVGITNASYEALEENMPDYDEDFMDIPNTALYFIQFQGMNADREYLYAWNYTEASDPTIEPPISEGPIFGDSSASAIITTIKNDLDSTRCLFIQDPNIRPAQEGDILRPGTMIHHVFLDSFPTAEMNYYPPMAQAHAINLANGEYQQCFATSGDSTEEGVELIFNGVDATLNTLLCSWEPGTNIVYSNQPSYILDPLDYNEQQDKFKIVADGSFTVDNDAILVNTTTLVHEHDYGYKRRIMPGDNLQDSEIVYFDFPTNYQPTNSGSFIELQNSNGGNYEFYEGDEYVDCCLNGETNFVFYEDQVNLSQLNLSSADGGINWDCVVSEVKTDVPAYRHCYVKKPNLRPLQVGDFIGPGTTLYFNFSDDTYTRTDADSTFLLGAEDWELRTLVDEADYAGEVTTGLRIGIDSYYGDGMLCTIYQGNSDSITTNVSSYTFPEKTWIHSVMAEGGLTTNFTTYCRERVLVDTNTLYRQIKEGDNIANQTIYNASQNNGYAWFEFDENTTILACSTSALKNTENFWLKAEKEGTTKNHIKVSWSPYLNNIINYYTDNDNYHSTNNSSIYTSVVSGTNVTVNYALIRFESPVPLYALNSMVSNDSDVIERVYRYFFLRGEPAEPTIIDL